MSAPAISYVHLARLSDDVGIFEHAELGEARVSTATASTTWPAGSSSLSVSRDPMRPLTRARRRRTCGS